MATKKEQGHYRGAAGQRTRSEPVTHPDSTHQESSALDEPRPREAFAERVMPAHLQPVPTAADDDLDDTDLEAFELNTSAPLVKPRRRRQVDYQTLRIQKHTWRIMRDSWLRARQIDPLVTFVEFSTVVIQRGLQALKEDRERGE
jgi:hypothetical protein